jgi:hypothetical protein
MRKITKRSAVIVATAAVVAGAAGAAFAAWTLNSSVDASTKAGHASQLTVTDVQILGTLVPGSTSSVKFTARNTNSFPVAISNIAYSDVTTDNGDCAPSNLQQISGAALPTDLALATAGQPGDFKTITFANSLRLKPDPDNACQDAKFTFKVNLTVASNA